MVQTYKVKVPSSRSLHALDFLNFFLADTVGGVSPYLGIYLLATYHWNPASIGIAMSAMGISTIAAQTPIGALIDKLTKKRLLIVVAASLIGISCIAITLFKNLYAVTAAQAIIGIVGVTFGPSIAAISLGMVGHKKLVLRVGRNEIFNHAGNVSAAVLAGLVGHFIAQKWIFYLVAAIAVPTIISVLLIKEEDIDHRLARGAKSKDDSEIERISGFTALLTDRRILIFALSGAIFHLANAAMLPLAGQYLATGNTRGSTLYMSACIIAAQVVMIPVAAFAGKFINIWGRKPVFLIAFAVLPIRGFLYTLSGSPFLIVAVQLLDGIGAGIFGVLGTVLAADLTKGTGRYNVTQGAIATVHGIGAALSSLVAGFVVKAAGYNAGFVTLAVIALVAFALFYIAMPETKDFKEVDRDLIISPKPSSP